MKLHLEWSKPVVLRDGRRQKLIYWTDLEKLPAVPGIYIFGRTFGRGFKKKFEALYVGKATRIRGRVKSQLNNLRLMQHLKYAKSGERVLLIGRFKSKPGQRVARSLPLAERSLIRYFLSEGHDLVNIQGTQLRRHEIRSTGKHPKRYFPRLIYLER